MTNKELLIKEIEQISEAKVQEVLDFVYFVKNKDKFDETVLMSESSLEKDWLKPEEEEAWRNL